MVAGTDDLIRAVEEFRQIHARLWAIAYPGWAEHSHETRRDLLEPEAAQKRLRRRLVHIESDIVEAFARARVPLPDLSFLDPADLDPQVERVIVRLRREDRPVPRSPKQRKPRAANDDGSHWSDHPDWRTILGIMTLLGGAAGIITLIAIFTDLL